MEQLSATERLAAWAKPLREMQRKSQTFLPDGSLVAQNLLLAEAILELPDAIYDRAKERRAEEYKRALRKITERGAND